jgi:hypothetical protein
VKSAIARSGKRYNLTFFIAVLSFVNV